MAGETLLTVVGSLVTTSYPGRAGLAVHAGCGRPAALPVVDSGLSTTDAGASDVAGSTPVPSDMCSDPQQPPASSPDVTNVTASPVDLPHATDPDTGRIVIEQPTEGKPKRGRPAKYAVDGLTVDKREGPQKWCVIHVASGLAVLTLLASKVKAQQAMVRLGLARGIAWTAAEVDRLHFPFIQNEQLRVIGSDMYSEELFNDYTRVSDSAAGPEHAAVSVLVQRRRDRRA